MSDTKAFESETARARFASAIEQAGTPVPLRVVPPPVVSNSPGVNAPKGTKDREGLLSPLTMRERALVCAVANTLQAFRYRAEARDGEHPDVFVLDDDEKQAIRGLLIAFKDATGCAWTDAQWD